MVAMYAKMSVGQGARPAKVVGRCKPRPAPLGGQLGS